jgi:hypothetical protein
VWQSRRRARRRRQRPRYPGRRPRCEEQPRSLDHRAEVDLPVAENVVDPSADDAEWHGPQRDIGYQPWLAAACDVALIAKPNGNDDAKDDGQCVGTHGYRTQIPRTLIGTGDGRG